MSTTTEHDAATTGAAVNTAEHETAHAVQAHDPATEAVAADPIAADEHELEGLKILALDSADGRVGFRFLAGVIALLISALSFSTAFSRFCNWLRSLCDTTMR